MSYSHISFALGAVVLILAGGFVAIILIDILFNWFDDIRAWFIAQQDKEQGVTRVTCSEAEHVRIDRETARELARLAARNQQQTTDARTARGLGVAGVVRSARVPGDAGWAPLQGRGHTTAGHWRLPEHQARVAGDRTAGDEKPVVDKPQPAPAGGEYCSQAGLARALAQIGAVQLWNCGCALCQHRRRSLDVAEAGRGPGRGDPPKGVAH